MTQQPAFQLTATVLDAPDPRKLADFYSRLLGWPIGRDEPDWARSGTRRRGRAVVPARVGVRQAHLAGRAGRSADAAAPGHRGRRPGGRAHAAAAGAVLADFQPQEDVRVFLDPAGHPFCLWVSSAS